MLEAFGVITNIEDFSDTFLIFISNLIVGVRGHTMHNFQYFKVNETCFIYEHVAVYADECSTCTWKEYKLCSSWVKCFINTNQITLVYSVVIYKSISFLIFFVLVPSITFISAKMSNYNRFLNVFFQLYWFLLHVFWQCSILAAFKKLFHLEILIYLSLWSVLF